MRTLSGIQCLLACWYLVSWVFGVFHKFNFNLSLSFARTKKWSVNIQLCTVHVCSSLSLSCAHALEFRPLWAIFQLVIKMAALISERQPKLYLLRSSASCKLLLNQIPQNVVRTQNFILRRGFCIHM